MSTLPARHVTLAARRVNWPFVIVAFAVHVGAFATLIGHWSWSGLAVAGIGQVIFGWIGVSMGYHRLLTHASFKVKPWLERTLATIGALAIQGGPIAWVATHIQHHAASDRDGDPHSPRRGFWWAHFGWMLRGGQRLNAFRAVERLRQSRYYRFLDAGQIALQFPLAGLLWLLGGWTFVLYGIFVRSVLVWHATFCVNSVCHVWGSRRYRTDDDSRNNHLIAWLTGGEGHHNDHHGEPRSARYGRRPWDFDPIWLLILGLEKLGLATDVVRPRMRA
jgi:stearoyl-CoA desaturase (delta-9 desaturase)